MLNWYLIYTKPKYEDIVSARLSGSDFEVFNPKLKERKSIRRKVVEVISPLFPCYIFVKTDLTANYRLLKYTRGIRRIVGTESLPAPVHQNIIDTIRASMEDGIVTVKPHRFLSGEEVEIKAGPFEGLEAIFICEMKGMERVSILLKEIDARVVIDGALLKTI
ncbi:MAG: hypothetical protein KAR06_11950 [Deltaproteobacteria bacterium]|nr:hypothetical protein [Deltaproteobacteria bacterium]